MQNPRPTHALVRPPGQSFVRALRSKSVPLDVPLAQAQHREYCQALVTAGLEVIALPPDEQHPDSCFIQDTAVVIGGLALICRLAEASRRGEEETVADWLAARFPLARVVAPGTLEGGDVLILHDRVWIGRSGRTNRAGIAQLAVALAERPETARLAVQEATVSGVLHLLTAVTCVSPGVFLALESFSDHPLLAGADVIVVPPAESAAANALAIGDQVILPAGQTQTAAALAARGFDVLPVPISEFAKADGGVTCLSVVWRE